MALNRTPRPPVRRREQRPLPPEWHQRAYRAFGHKRKEQLSFRERLARIHIAPKSRRMKLLYWIAAIGMILLLMIPLFNGSTFSTPQVSATPSADLTPSADQTPAPTTSAAVEKPTWPAPPAMTIDTSKNYIATFDTAKGTIKAQLFPKDAPKTVNNFVFLAQQGFYDGLSFHRVIRDFMAQGGDPNGNGTGGPGYKFEDEIANNPLNLDSAGMLAMANSGPNTNGSQFFITTTPQKALDGGYTVFGQVTDGLDVVKSLTQGDPLPPDKLKDNLIQHVTITEAP